MNLQKVYLKYTMLIATLFVALLANNALGDGPCGTSPSCKEFKACDGHAQMPLSTCCFENSSGTNCKFIVNRKRWCDGVWVDECVGSWTGSSNCDQGSHVCY